MHQAMSTILQLVYEERSYDFMQPGRLTKDMPAMSLPGGQHRSEGHKCGGDPAHTLFQCGQDWIARPASEATSRSLRWHGLVLM